MKIFAIESSCDETAAAIVEDGVKEISSTVASSKDVHEATGGVVPEVAARKQVEFIVPVIEKTLEKAKDSLGLSDTDQVVAEIDALAVTVGPGLIGSLVVGVEAAKALSLAWSKSLIPVNHLIGHIYANWVANSGSDHLPEFPAIVLIVSGGHTEIVLMKDHGDFKYLGGTIDDAAGEAFDKTARLLGLAKYLGGVELSKKAAMCEENALKGKLPRSFINEDNYDFSFSGLKTAVKRMIEAENGSPECIAREFEDAVVDVLVAKTTAAARNFQAKSILLAGGVSANSTLRERMRAAAGEIPLFVPPVELCTDNAVYIASAAYFNRVYPSLEKVQASSSLDVVDLTNLK
jgi:N6-L-threonylcarbamoyladenine synthase